jgi:hypothetical protein
MPQPALIATMPRSGTWYMLLFFWTYDRLLRAKWRHSATGYAPSIINEVLDGGAKDKRNTMSDAQDLGETLGIKPLYVQHTICPGYYSANDPQRGEWDKLKFFLPYDGHERIGEDFDRLDPAKYSNARIIYLYRNPLDHFVSYFRVTQHDEWERQRFREDESGNLVPIADLRDFIFNGPAIEGYVKQIHTFRVMRRLYPQNVLMLPYEEMTAKPRETLVKILAYFGAPVRGPLTRKAFGTAFRLTERESVKGIEQKMDRSLTGRLQGGQRHVMSGEAGQWQGKLNENDLDRIDQALRRFDMSLSDFKLS